jgi:transcriptional regulator with XRE-family HTH domain
MPCEHEVAIVPGATQSPPGEPAPTAVAPEPAGIDRASNEEVAMRIGENVMKQRAKAGLSLRELEEAAETNFSHIARIEEGRGAVPQLALILKLAGSLNVRCSLLTAGVVWDAASSAFQVLETPPPPQTALACLGRTRVAPYGLDLPAGSQRHRLDESRRSGRLRAWQPELQDLGALGFSFGELFAGVANWHIRPLAPPEFLPGEAPTSSTSEPSCSASPGPGRCELRVPAGGRSHDAKLGWYILLGTIPISFFGFLFRDQIASGARSLYLIGSALILFSFVVLAADRLGTRERDLAELNRRDGWLIGFAQSLALVPGISRSGATISAGLFRGFDRVAAARYSFLLSVPAAVLSGLFLSCARSARTATRRSAPL